MVGSEWSAPKGRSAPVPTNGPCRQSRSGDVVHTPCPLFVPIAEEGWADHEVARLAAREYLAPLLDKGLIHWCWAAPTTRCSSTPCRRSSAPSAIGRLGGGDGEGRKRPLEQDQRRRPPASPPRYFVTDIPERFKRVGGAFLGAPLTDVTTVVLD